MTRRKLRLVTDRGGGRPSTPRLPQNSQFHQSGLPPSAARSLHARCARSLFARKTHGVLQFGIWKTRSSRAFVVGEESTISASWNRQRGVLLTTVTLGLETPHFLSVAATVPKVITCRGASLPMYNLLKGLHQLRHILSEPVAANLSSDSKCCSSDGLFWS